MLGPFLPFLLEDSEVIDDDTTFVSGQTYAAPPMERCIPPFNSAL